MEVLPLGQGKFYKCCLAFIGSVEANEVVIRITIKSGHCYGRILK